MSINKTVRVEYIGKKDTRVDTVAGTGVVWYGTGDVQTVPAEAWPRMSRHADVWRLAEEQDSDESQAAGLMGTDKMPSLVDIAEGHQAQLGDIVRGAFAESGATVDEWNGLDPDVRDELIAGHLEAVRAAFNPGDKKDPPPPPPAKRRGGRRARA